MKILHVIGSMNPTSGGPCQGIRNMDGEMRKRGVSRTVVSLDEPAAAFIADDPFEICGIGKGFSSWQYSKKMKQWLTGNISNFDIVIVNGLWLYTGYVTRQVMRNLRMNGKKVPKMYVMPHGMLDPYFQKVAERRLKALRNLFYWHLIEKKVVQEADALLFTCEMELELARTTFKSYHPKKEINVGYGITMPPAFSETMKIAFEKVCPEIKGRPFLLFLSRIHEKKGVDILLDAYKAVLEKYSTDQIHIPLLVIAGPGIESTYGKKMVEKVKEDVLLRNTVFFPGMLSGNEKWGAFYCCDAFVLPSHQENFGIAIVEAMACKKAVLITDKINIYREISSSHSGLVEEDNVNGITRLLNKWIQLTDEHKENMKANAYNAFNVHFGVENAVDKIINLTT